MRGILYDLVTRVTGSSICGAGVRLAICALILFGGSQIQLVSQTYSDNVGIGTATPDPSALLELKSSEKGFLITRVTQAERDAIQQPATGLLIFNVTTNTIQYNIGTKFAPVWVSMLYINVDGGSSSGIFWSLAGNDSVDASKHFLGTTNQQALIFKTDSVTRMTLTATGEIIVEGNTSITGQLDLTGATSPLSLDGNPGIAGQVLVSAGPGSTPRYTDTLTLNQLTTIGDVLVGGNLSVTGNARFIDTASFDVLPNIPLAFGNILVGDSTDRARPLVPGLEGSLMQIAGGVPTWVKPDEAAYWSITGNAGMSATNFLGTVDASDLNIATNSQLRATFTGTGEFSINVPTRITGALELRGPSSPLELNGDAGLSGRVLVSMGPGNTPRYTDTLILSSLTVNGPAFFTDTANFSRLPSIPLQNNYLLVGDSSNLANPFPPAADSTFLAIFNGRVQWFDLGLLLRNTAWIVGGNNTVGSPILGNLDTTGIRDLHLYAGGKPLITLDGTNYTATIAAPVNLSGSTTSLSLNGDAGTVGQVLISQGAGVTPRYTDSLLLASLTVSGHSRFIDTAKFDVFPKFPLEYGFLIVGDSTGNATVMAPGLEGSLMQVSGGIPRWVTPDQANYWSLDGNAGTSATNFLGTTDANDLRIATNSALRATFTATGEFNVDVPTRITGSLNLAGPNSPLQVNGDAGTSGWVLISQGANQTPVYTDSLVLRAAVINSSLALNGTASLLTLNGDPGVAGQVLISQGPSATPRYTDSLTLSTIRITGESYFEDTSHYDVFMDFPLQHGYLIVGDSTGKAQTLAPGLEGSLMQVFNGQPTWVTPDQANYWSLSGNGGISATDFLGTTDANDLRIATNGALRATFTATGTLDVQVPTNITGALTLAGANSPLQLNGDAGTPGFVLVSQGANQTPVYTDSLGLRGLSVSGSTYLGGPLTVDSSSTFTYLPDMPLQQNYILVGDATNRAAPFAPGADSTVFATIGGSVVWWDIKSILKEEKWLVGGNPVVTSPKFGVLDSTGAIRNLEVYAGGRPLLTFDGTQYTASLNAPLNFNGANVSLSMNGDAGTIGKVLISQGPGNTPRWTDTLTLGSLTVTGESFFLDTAEFSVFPKFPLQHGYMIVGDSTNTSRQFAPGLEGSLLQIEGGLPTWVSPDQAQYWSLSGNAGVGATAFLGTTDANDLRLATNNNLRMTIGAANGDVTINSLAGTPATTPLDVNDGIVIADGNGTITKRDKSVLLGLLGITAGRYENTGATTQYTVVINIPGGFVLDAAASITITPEATSSVSITPFVVAGSRTPNSFSISFPGGLDPGEAINWLVKNP